MSTDKSPTAEPVTLSRFREHLKAVRLNSVRQIPASVVALHQRVRNGLSDAEYGKTIKIVGMAISPTDRARWPVFKNAKVVWLGYGSRRLKGELNNGK